MSDEKTGFDEWSIIEVFGHQKLAGRVTEQALGGASFIRVDVPAVDGRAAFTKLLGAAAIYSIVPTTEALVMRALEHMHVAPVSVYIPPEAPKRLPGETPPGVAGGGREHDCVECGSPCTCPDPDDCEGCDLHDHEDDDLL